jgi:8-oxo-dGTP pyrophosphatase MutT (NUDIX family)
MALRPRRAWPIGFDPEQARQAAGLLLIYPEDTRPLLVLTIRSDTLGHHGGQVSLPGGVIEPGETREHAARREAQEEVGLRQEDVQVLGALTPVDIAVSGFRLHPILATTISRPLLRPLGSEVSRILGVAVDELMDPGCHAWRSIDRGADSFDYPVFVIGGVDIWGATAMVLAELLSLVGWLGPKPRDP